MTDASQTSTNPVDLNAMLKMFQDMMEQSMQMVTGKDGGLKDMPMDPTVFMKKLKEMTQKLMDSNTNNMNPFMDPLTFMKKNFGTEEGKSMFDLADPKAFFDMCELTLNRARDMATSKDGEPSDMAKIMNPMWWMQQMTQTMTRAAGNQQD